VSLWLPVTCPDEEAGSPSATLAEPDSGETALVGLHPRVLLVDDEPVVREVLAAGLAEEGCEVSEAVDGPAALAMLESGLAVDLLVSDLAMPGMDGAAVIREARRRRPHLPAILLTGFAGDASALEAGALDEGPFALLRKPVSAPRLADEMAVLLAVARARREAARRPVPG
jgi:CheY-like chemotaxis protein